MQSFFARISGKLLGHGYITKKQNNRPYFYYTYQPSDFEWALYCCGKLKDYIQIHLKSYIKANDYNQDKRYSKRYTVKSNPSPTLEKLYNIWYSKGKKDIPFDFLQ